jgi:hypothetical protein
LSVFNGVALQFYPNHWWILSVNFGVRAQGIFLSKRFLE